MDGCVEGIACGTVFGGVAVEYVCCGSEVGEEGGAVFRVEFWRETGALDVSCAAVENQSGFE